MRFVLMGDGPSRVALERSAAGLDSIQFCRAVQGDRYPRVLAAADILLVNERPGIAEMAVPSKLTSYFFSGRPVVASTGPSGATSREILLSGGGVVAAPGAPEVLLATILQMWEDPAELARLGAAGRRYAIATLSRDAAIGAYEIWAARLASRSPR